MYYNSMVSSIGNCQEITHLKNMRNMGTFEYCKKYKRSFVIVLKTTRSSTPEMFLQKAILTRYSNFAGEHLSRSVISKKLLCLLKLHFEMGVLL